MSLTDSLFVFVGGLVLMLVLALLRRRSPGLVVTAHRLACSLVFGILLLEAGLRLFPGLLKGELANFTYGGYHHQAGGIYTGHPNLAHALRAGYGRTIYWSGHWWRHDANAGGFRGPMLEKADVVFLGDSMIYGHGVDNDQTVSAQFQQLTGKPSANLGVQAYSAVHNALQFDRLGVPLRPRYVLLCCHPNDMIEVILNYPAEEVERYLSAEPAYSVKPIARGQGKTDGLREFRLAWGQHVSLPLRSARAISGLFRLIAARGAQAAANEAEEDWVLPSQASIDEPFDPRADEQTELTWRAYQYAIAQIKSRCDELGAKLIVFDLGYPTAFCDATRDYVQSIGAQYSDAGRQVLRAGLDGEHVYLKNDGHWTPLGCRLIAEALAKAIEGE